MLTTKKTIALIIAVALLSSMSTLALASAYTAVKNPFADVSADAYYYDAVLWAVEHGITKGTAPDKFSPNAPCTRAEVISFLYRSSQADPSVQAAGTLLVNDKEYALTSEDVEALTELLTAGVWSPEEYAEFIPAYVVRMGGTEYRFPPEGDYVGFNVVSGTDDSGMRGEGAEAEAVLARIYELLTSYAVYEQE